mmetsp:Transcript_19959/g.63165  ORF Transcript_19959/g.63165 Transcript_19959/m.63165 type:complete len:211 (-) Transcript_19959:60-692(-)
MWRLSRSAGSGRTQMWLSRRRSGGASRDMKLSGYSCSPAVALPWQHLGSGRPWTRACVAASTLAWWGDWGLAGVRCLSRFSGLWCRWLLPAVLQHLVAVRACGAAPTASLALGTTVASDVRMTMTHSSEGVCKTGHCIACGRRWRLGDGHSARSPHEAVPRCGAVCGQPCSPFDCLPGVTSSRYEALAGRWKNGECCHWCAGLQGTACAG